MLLFGRARLVPPGYCGQCQRPLVPAEDRLLRHWQLAPLMSVCCAIWYCCKTETKGTQWGTEFQRSDFYGLLVWRCFGLSLQWRKQDESLTCGWLSSKVTPLSNWFQQNKNVFKYNNCSSWKKLNNVLTIILV